ncbi:hypothetical protein SDC9_126081 [bioreactor metagenome]|uniref:Uncharacterized protein n=1 Tax=bioreactor metagenome TaxID=1076179 RepID=A0A645CPN1_9ZZZZ
MGRPASAPPINGPNAPTDHDTRITTRPVHSMRTMSASLNGSEYRVAAMFIGAGSAPAQQGLPERQNVAGNRVLRGFGVAAHQGVENALVFALHLRHMPGLG